MMVNPLKFSFTFISAFLWQNLVKLFNLKKHFRWEKFSFISNQQQKRISILNFFFFIYFHKNDLQMFFFFLLSIFMQSAIIIDK